MARFVPSAARVSNCTAGQGVTSGISAGQAEIRCGGAYREAMRTVATDTGHADRCCPNNILCDLSILRIL